MSVQVGVHLKGVCTKNVPDKYIYKYCILLSIFSFNRIDIPPYESYEKFHDKLTCAVEETCGFAVE